MNCRPPRRRPPFNGDQPAGECNYGVSMTFVGVTWTQPLACPSWTNEPDRTIPSNLFLAQLALRPDLDPSVYPTLTMMQPEQLPPPVSTPLPQSFLNWFYLLHDAKVAYLKALGRKAGISVESAE